MRLDGGRVVGGVAILLSVAAGPAPAAQGTLADGVLRHLVKISASRAQDEARLLE